MTYPTEGEKNVQGWRVIRMQTSRGHGMKTGEEDGPLVEFVGLTLWCEDLASPGEFLFSIEDAERAALALLDTVAKARES